MGFNRRGRWPRKNAKLLLESVPALDIIPLHKAVDLREPFTFFIDVAQEVVWGRAEAVGISLTYPDGHTDTLMLRWVPCGLGGQRPLAGCPECGRGAIKFYLVQGRFRCRRCHRLQYATTRLSDVDAAKARLSKIRQRLGDEGGPLEPAPWKPRGMWTRRYLQLLDQFNDAQGQALEEFGKRLGRLAERLASN